MLRSLHPLIKPKLFLRLRIILILLLLGGPCYLAHAQITDQPDDLEVCEGASAIFSITISGTDSAFQWQTLIDSEWSNLSNTGNYLGTASAEMQIIQVDEVHHLAFFRCLVDLNGDNEWDDSSRIAKLTVITIPVITGPIKGEQSLCSGSKEVTYTVTPADGATSYEWAVPAGALITSEQNRPQITIDFMTAASGIISVFPSNRCHSGEAVFLPVTLIPEITAIPQISGKTEVCEDEMDIVYTVAPIMGASEYEWKVPQNVTIKSGQGTHTITVDWNDADNGPILVEAKNSCFKSPFGFLNVTVGKEVSDPGLIVGTDTVCFGSLGTIYQIAPVTNAAEYDWFVPSGATIVSEQNAEKITIDWNGSASGIISVNALNWCYAGGTSEKEVTVLPEINPAEIEGADEICYNTMPLPLKRILPASGGDENFTYQWQESSDNLFFTNIENEQDSDFQPDKMVESTYFRLSTISDFGCLTTYSDAALIKVFDQFTVGSLRGSDNFCYMEDPGTIGFETAPSGGNEDYIYKWQQSVQGGFWRNAGSDSASLLPGALTEDTDLRVIVSDSKGCGTDTSNTFHINVYDSFQPGTIAFDDTLCAGSNAAKVVSVSLPRGGDGSYSYKWNLSYNLTNWQEIIGERNETLDPGPLQHTTYYRRSDISGSGCGELNTGSVIRFVHPLPAEITYSGKYEVCRNESDLIYSFEENQSMVSHSWEISGGKILSHLAATSIKVNWDTQEHASLILVRENNITGCIRESDLGIQKNNMFAPDKSEIIRKYESDMLIVMDTTPGVKHIWWYNDLMGADSIKILENEKRYCALPHTFDSTKYSYWITTAFIEDQEWECRTNSYLGNSLIRITPPIMGLPEINIYPNPTDGILHIGPISGTETPVLCKIFDLNGKPVLETIIQYPGDTNNLDLLRKNLGPGIYMLTLYTKYGTVSETLVIH